MCIQLLLELVSRNGDESAQTREINAKKRQKRRKKKHIANIGRTETHKKMSRALTLTHTQTRTHAGVRVSVLKMQAQGHLQQKDGEGQRTPSPKKKRQGLSRSNTRKACLRDGSSATSFIQHHARERPQTRIRKRNGSSDSSIPSLSIGGPRSPSRMRPPALVTRTAAQLSVPHRRQLPLVPPPPWSAPCPRVSASWQFETRLLRGS